MTRPEVFLVVLSLWTLATCAGGLRLELRHVDAKANITMAERIRRADERTHRRVASVLAVAPVYWGGTQYVAEYSIGDPPQQTEAVVDTLSDLVWTQCTPCNSSYCFPQRLPQYNLSRSRTAHPVPCNGTLCAAAHEVGGRCSGDKNGACAIRARYDLGDVGGFLGVEEFTFGSEKVTVAFGIITTSNIDPGLNGASGLVGLGRGALSLVSQLGGDKFSYCFTPYFKGHLNTSPLFVGSSANMSVGGNNTRGVITTVPFVASPKDEPFNILYYLPLVGMTVGEARLAIPSTAFDMRQVAPGMWAGGAIIDSGSPFTLLVDVAYEALKQEVARQLHGSLVPSPVPDLVELCVASVDVGRLAPPLVLHFSGGGDLAVPAENYWAAVDEETACMVVLSAARVNLTMPMNETTVIGNYMQQNVHVLYDLGNGHISFQPADCNSI
ncbi:aspartic proteinase nepenthesin-1-like [Lolium rigidum]|uniref:aspartic proteinase nepenthesin-1-like n=1 Tax=Lolium rigidum TaxID=89674 RepID=UPI001F5C46FC|nr:aspartic proteinase nepenthesin-1-like [Lolium rigidum]